MTYRGYRYCLEWQAQDSATPHPTLDRQLLLSPFHPHPPPFYERPLDLPLQMAIIHLIFGTSNYCFSQMCCKHPDSHCLLAKLFWTSGTCKGHFQMDKELNIHYLVFHVKNDLNHYRITAPVPI